MLTFCITGVECVTQEQLLCYVCFRKLDIDPSGTVFAGDPMCDISSMGENKAKVLFDKDSPDKFFQWIGEKETLLIVSK